MPGETSIPIGVSSSSASSSVSTASSNQSISFNPVITLASPEASIRNQPSTEQTSRVENSASSDASAKAESKLSGVGSGDPSSGLTGLLPGLGLNSSRNTTSGGGPFTIAGDLVPSAEGNPVGGMLSGTNGLLLMGGLAVAAFFLARKFL